MQKERQRQTTERGKTLPVLRRTFRDHSAHILRQTSMRGVYGVATIKLLECSTFAFLFLLSSGGKLDERRSDQHAS